MKTISLLQPWATLVVTGLKQYETRSWDTKYRGELLIHASKKNLWIPELGHWLREVEYDHYPKVYGAIIGKVTLVGTYPTMSLKGQMSSQELAFGDWAAGRYCWKLENPIRFEDPIPCKGSLSIWEYAGTL